MVATRVPCVVGITINYRRWPENLMIRRPPRSTQSRSSAASDVYKRQGCYYSIVTLMSYAPNSTMRRAWLSSVDSLTTTRNYRKISSLFLIPCSCFQLLGQHGIAQTNSETDRVATPGGRPTCSRRIQPDLPGGANVHIQLKR